jgi:hypothetical protein
MRQLAPLLLVLLAPIRLLAGDDPVAAGVPRTPVAGRTAEEVTIDRKDQFEGGVGFGGPLGFGATIGLLHGLDADVEDEDGRVRAVCAVPIPHCAGGFLLEADAGSGGGKLSIGLGARARVDEDGFHGAVAASMKASLVRTWGSPVGTETGLTYLGPELELSAFHLAASAGVLWRVAGRGGSSALFCWGFGFRL